MRLRTNISKSRNSYKVGFRHHGISDYNLTKVELNEILSTTKNITIDVPQSKNLNVETLKMIDTKIEPWLKTNNVKVNLIQGKPHDV